jgi:hypothetical protein
VKGIQFALILAIGALVASPSSFAQERRGLLTRAEQRLYHACLMSAWVQDYCHSHSVGYIWDQAAAYHECLAANRAPDVPAPYTLWYGTQSKQDCWDLAKSAYR